MSVKRYRDVSEMPDPPRAVGPDLARRIRELMSRSVRLAGAGYPPGVHRFRTLEEAQRARDEVAALRARRRRDRRT